MADRCFRPACWPRYLLLVHLPAMATVTAPDTSVPGIAEVLSPVDLPPVFFSFTPDEAWAVPRDSWWLSVSNWAIHQERIQGARIQSLGDWTDRMLSASATSEPGNRSYLRLGFATESDYSDLARFEPEARFRLDLPTTRRKLRLLIESESEELIPLEERQRDRQLTDTERTDTQTTGALRYLSSIGDAIHLSNDIGGRLRFPPDAFWRATAGQTLHRAGGWTLGWQQRLYYYHQSGWGARTWAGASRALPAGWQFRSSSELEWQHEERKFVAAQIFSFSRDLDSRSSLIPRIGILGESRPNWRTSAYFADVSWRYRLHSDWLYAELVPAVTFPRDEDFSDQGSVVLRLEMFFAGTLERR